MGNLVDGGLYLEVQPRQTQVPHVTLRAVATTSLPNLSQRVHPPRRLQLGCIVESNVF